jgi:hypothetical protein
MADPVPLSVTISPDTPFALAEGETRTIVAAASEKPDEAAYEWTLNGSDPTQGAYRPVTAFGLYRVRVTLGEREASAELEVTGAADHPAWHPEFARWSAIGLSGGGVLLFLPGVILAWKSGVGQSSSRSAVAGMLVVAGALALVAAIFLFLNDYRGRAVTPPSDTRRGGSRGLDVGATLKAAGDLIGTFGTATRGAAALLLGAVAIFGFAAWAAIGGNPAAGSGTPDPSATTAVSSP